MLVVQVEVFHPKKERCDLCDHPLGRQSHRGPQADSPKRPPRRQRCLERSSQSSLANAGTKVRLLTYGVSLYSNPDAQWAPFIGNDCARNTGSTVKAYSKTGRRRAETVKTCFFTRRMTSTTFLAQSSLILSQEYATWRLSLIHAYLSDSRLSTISSHHPLRTSTTRKIFSYPRMGVGRETTGPRGTLRVNVCTKKSWKWSIVRQRGVILSRRVPCYQL